ncbi:MAG TPA: VWA domain-containing protein [Candidatus Saccharimonadales bacterium]|jgi:VWFA-related protein|nr:VWA domain-containing protein [Candidatus Saccharimonadales bacterium]
MLGIWLFGLVSGLRKLTIFLALAGLACAAQEIPDAPTPKTPLPSGTPFPAGSPPAPKNSRPEGPPPEATGTPADKPTTPRPLPNPGDVASSRDDLFTLTVNVSFVQVPVTVKDSFGRLVEGLAPHDFTVYEDGVPQKLSFFSSDPFPLSAAVVVDSNLPASTMKKVNETLPGLISAFSQFDEVALYRYGSNVQQVSNFVSASEVPTESLNRLKRTGRQGGAPVTGGPLSQQGTTVNGRPVDPSLPQVSTSPVPQETNVLNDAVLRAALDLSRRDKGEQGVRRRIIFLISNGREYGSSAHYEDVRRVLLSQNITVYALGVDTAALPIYDKLNRVRLPGFGRGDALPRYVSDTGGEMFAELDRQSIDSAYGKITEVARNQYTLGYSTRATPSSSYRTIDVRVHRPNLTVQAKEGYFPLPPQRH